MKHPQTEGQPQALPSKQLKNAVFLKSDVKADAAMGNPTDHAKTRMWQDVVPVCFQWDVLAAARRYHLPAPLLAAVLHMETGHQPNPATAVSAAGAIGPMQLMPNTAWDQLRVNPWRPAENIFGGARYLAQLIREFHGLRSALMAYNAGPTAVYEHKVPEQAVYYARHVIHQSRMLSTY